MGGGLESHCVGRVYGADGVVSLSFYFTKTSPVYLTFRILLHHK